MDDDKEINLDKKFVDFINTHLSDLTVTTSDISVVHRTGRSHPTATSQDARSTARVQPIVVRFAKRDVRNQVLLKRKELKGKRISITEQLTNNRAQLLKRANELVNGNKVLGAWSHDGKILIKTPDNRITQIASIADLEKY